MIELVEREAPAVVRLRQVHALRAALDAAEAQAILDLAREALLLRRKRREAQGLLGERARHASSDLAGV